MSLETFFNPRSLAIVGASQRKGKVGYEILASTTQVKMTLRYYHTISDFPSQVHTNRGVVTLRGKARNIVEKDLITQLVSDVYGVRSVKNQMAIEEVKSR